MHGYDSEDIRRDYRNALDMILADCGAGNTSFDPRAISVLQGLHQSQNTSAEAQADWVAKFQGRYGECSQDELLELFNPAVNRTPIPDAVLEDIRCPVLILAGSVDRATSPERAYELSESLSRVPGGADVHLIHNAPHWSTCSALSTRYFLS